jgi:L-2-hydroxyglutarate oxidase LhgO
MRIAIIGGGVVGLALGIKALEAFSNVNVTLFEKESELGLHASTRNSGVLHSGLYYSSESLKAKFSREGNRQLRDFIRSKNIPLLETGKLILTKDEFEMSQLEKLAARASSNGVEVEIHNQELLGTFQSGAKTAGKFLFSPTTAVSDPGSVLNAMEREFKDKGGRIFISTTITAATTGKNRINSLDDFDWVINSAGGGALRYAQSQGVGLEFGLMPFLGLYWGSKQLAAKLSVPLYPVPHPINPFLGVHLTPTSKGIGKIGPTAIPVVGSEQYKLLRFPNIRELTQTISAGFAMMRGEKHSLGGMIATEAKYLIRSNMVKDAALMFPGAAEISDWKLVPGGIRSQLVNKSSGALLDDFLVETVGNTTHILNAVSPGWTSALSFAEWVIDEHCRGR